MAVICTACKVGSLVGSGSAPAPENGTHVVYVSQPTSTTTDADISPAVQVQVVDSLGNAIPYDGTVTIFLEYDGSVLKDGSLLGTTTVTAANGAASFGDLHIHQTGVGYTLGASIPTGSAPAVSQPFDVIPL